MRKCGSCDVCCYIAKVEDKPAYSICPSLQGFKKKKKCKLFGKEERPAQCSSYQCSWLRGYGFENEHRPDKCGLIVSVSALNGGVWIFAQELVKDAALTTGKQMLIAVASDVDVPVIVVSSGSRPPDDTGDFTIVKSKLRVRAVNMTGECLGYLDADNVYGMYELVGGGT